MRAIVQCFALVIILAGLNACVLSPPRPLGALPQQQHDSVQRQWWVARFRIFWPRDKEPDWAADHLLAHAVVAPALHAQAARIPLWRFHRRAARDAAGHQLSFLFYTDAGTAQRVHAAIRAHPVSQQMLAAGFAEHQLLGAYDHAQPGLVQATSDPVWSPAMQRHWPVYIMGVSALWLGLIDEFAATDPLPEELPAMLSHYRRVAQAIRVHWRGEGMHALLHHLSAAFGYVPLPVGEGEIRF